MQVSLAPRTKGSSAKLTVKSWTRWGDLEFCRKEGATYFYFDNNHWDGRYEAERPRRFLDAWEDLLDPSEPTRWALFIYGTHSETEGRYVCIVAVPHPKTPNCFTRFGIGLALNSDFFGDMGETDAAYESQRCTDGPDFTIQDLV
ncbi:uncharacterized protein EKO05_0005211 [Ascochyta rabiei]|uniref:Uncharacterized protein n=1 Tax=Didymella rabiei TaxID=5454 RepID=A0A163A3X9_DIDRA|nr:uncharacterized protein EKO05_0005211 [Ascochyta rabiei]KZM20969.1 hypothetical protein ST47_g7862 [Ascochyta rabiei]UPX14737.1 hypothetical protein EKO05_0005211 [Ascochyta rabiei]